MNMDGQNMRYLWVFMAVLCATGCHSKAGKQFPDNKICTSASQQEAMDTSVKVLERIGFSIEKADAPNGYISTRALPAAQFFEFWRGDTRGGYNWVESNTQSIERTAELTITEEDGQVCVKCAVTILRLSLPEKEVSSSKQMPGLYSRSGVGMQRLAMNEGQRAGSEWVDMGPDKELEAYILKKIDKKLGKITRKKK